MTTERDPILDALRQEQRTNAALRAELESLRTQLHRAATREQRDQDFIAEQHQLIETLGGRPARAA